MLNDDDWLRTLSACPLEVKGAWGEKPSVPAPPADVQPGDAAPPIKAVHTDIIEQMFSCQTNDNERVNLKTSRARIQGFGRRKELKQVSPIWPEHGQSEFLVI